MLDIGRRPFSLDVYKRQGHEVISLLLETSRTFHQTIVMITHNEEIARIADRVIRMEDGQWIHVDCENFLPFCR